MKKAIKTMLAISLLSAFNINAETQGALVHGATNAISSTGDLDVTLDVDYVIQINRLNDINFGTYRAGMDTNLNKGERFCIFTNASSFSLEIESMFVDGNLEPALLGQTTSELLPIELFFGEIDTNKNRKYLNQISDGAILTGLTEVRNHQNCSMPDGAGGREYQPNAVIRVKIKEDKLLNVLPDSYKGTLTLTASPE